jgi:glycosyltransferase involved in cell wall biosynthesis
MVNRGLQIVMVSTFYPPYHLGGDAVHVYLLANELAKAGHSVHVIHSLDSYYLNRVQQPQGSYPNVSGVHVYPLKTGIGKRAPLMCGFGGFDWPLVNIARNLIIELRPDVVHYHNIVGFGPGLLEKRLASRVLYTAHDYWLICERNNLLRPRGRVCAGLRGMACSWCSIKWRRPPQIWRLFKKIRQDSVDLVIAPSKYMEEKLVERGLKAQAVTMYNFISEPPPVAGHANGGRYFLYVGLLAKHKGINNLAEAFLQDEVLGEQELVMVGSGPEEGNLRALMAKTGRKNVTLAGEVRDKEQLFKLYKSAKALVIPSTWPENNPLVALEAASMGTPLIVTPMGGLPELSNIYDNTFVLEGDSTEKLESGIKRWLDMGAKQGKPLDVRALKEGYIEKILSLMNQ